MSTITDDVLSRINGTTAEAKKEAKRTGELGQEEFLELMIAQIQNQDPFKPMENGEFIAQMAQFATVDGIGEMHKSMQSLNETITANQALTASSLVGRNVLAPTSEVRYDGSEPVSLSVLAEPGSTSIVLDVLDAAGATVARKQIDASPDGVTRYAWDGTATDGAPLPAGTYRMQAQAFVDGEAVAADITVARRIDSVTLGKSAEDLRLNLDDGRTMNFTDAREFL